MNDGQFTSQAALFWAMIPTEIQTQILANVFCVNCHSVAQMTKFTGKEHKGDVLLVGACAKCGHEVVRVLEASEIDHSKN